LSLPIIEIAFDIGLENSCTVYLVEFSKISKDQEYVYYNQQLFLRKKPLIPLWFFKLISSYFNQLTRTPGNVDDESIYEFLSKNSFFWSEKHKNEIINIHTDAVLQSIYGGDIKKLSARSVSLFSKMFNKTYNIENTEYQAGYVSTQPEALKLYKSMISEKYKYFRFKGGMKSLTDKILSNLKSVRLIDDHVVSMDEDKPELKLSNGEVLKFDYIISTVNSNILSNIYPKLSYQIPHTTWTTVNLGYSSTPYMKGFGYSVPSIESQNIYSCVYNYSLFPDNSPTVTIFGKSNPEVLVNEYQKHTGCKLHPDFVHSSRLIDCLPHYNVGHYLHKISMKKNKPDWLHIGGHSFYHTSIPSCVNRSYTIVEIINKVSKLY
jgi:protoporphyrinogen/coproporphyrinogen III oxidase